MASNRNLPRKPIWRVSWQHHFAMLARRIWNSRQNWAPIALVFSVVTNIATIWYSHQSRHTAELTNRPYVGPVEFNLISCRMLGAYCNPVTVDQANNLEFHIVFKNSGNIPADSVRLIVRPFADGIEFKTDDQDVPSRVLAQQSFETVGETGTQEFQNVLQGRKTLELRIIISYDWPGGHEQSCYWSRFNPRYVKFEDRGYCK